MEAPFLQPIFYRLNVLEEFMQDKSKQEERNIYRAIAESTMMASPEQRLLACSVPGVASATEADVVSPPVKVDELTRQYLENSDKEDSDYEPEQEEHSSDDASIGKPHADPNVNSNQGKLKDTTSKNVLREDHGSFDITESGMVSNHPTSPKPSSKKFKGQDNNMFEAELEDSDTDSKNDDTEE